MEMKAKKHHWKAGDAARLDARLDTHLGRLNREARDLRLEAGSECPDPTSPQSLASSLPDVDQERLLGAQRELGEES